jgi:hypothetical protein
MLEPPRPVLLDHDEAALGYACEMANKLRRSGYNDPVKVLLGQPTRAMTTHKLATSSRRNIFLRMTNRFGVELHPESVRWAAAEGVSEDVIAAFLLLHQRRVDEIVPKLSAAELEQVIKLVGRSPRVYPPGTLDALKQRRALVSPEPPQGPSDGGHSNVSAHKQHRGAATDRLQDHLMLQRPSIFCIADATCGFPLPVKCPRTANSAAILR